MVVKVEKPESVNWCGTQWKRLQASEKRKRKDHMRHTSSAASSETFTLSLHSFFTVVKIARPEPTILITRSFTSSLCCSFTITTSFLLVLLSFFQLDNHNTTSAYYGPWSTVSVFFQSTIESAYPGPSACLSCGCVRSIDLPSSPSQRWPRLARQSPNLSTTSSSSHSPQMIHQPQNTCRCRCRCRCKKAPRVLSNQPRNQLVLKA